MAPTWNTTQFLLSFDRWEFCGPCVRLGQSRAAPAVAGLKRKCSSTIEIPSDFQDIPELNKAQGGDTLARVKAENNMSTWMFAPARQHVLMYVRHRKPILLEIGAGGFMREVRIEAPPGYVIQDLILRTIAGSCSIGRMACLK